MVVIDRGTGQMNIMKVLVLHYNHYPFYQICIKTFDCMVSSYFIRIQLYVLTQAWSLHPQTHNVVVKIKGDNGPV